jgi:hypothetical protein
MVTIKVERELTSEFIGDILVTAFDGSYGGCWYWCRPAGDGWLTVEGDSGEDYWKEVEIYEDEENKALVVSPDVIALGFQRAIDNNYPWAFEAVVSMDAGLIDSLGADVVVQLGLFGEVVYG